MGENLIYVPREGYWEVFSYVMDKVKRKDGTFYAITTLRKHKIHFAGSWENGDGNCREQGDDYMIFVHNRGRDNYSRRGFIVADPSGFADTRLVSSRSDAARKSASFSF